MEPLATARQLATQSKGAFTNLSTIGPRSQSLDVDEMSLDTTTASTDVASGPAPDILFTSVSDVFERIEKLDGDALVVGDISAANFRDLELERDARERKFRLFYLPDAGCLIITVPTYEHEDMHGSLHKTLMGQIADMGLLQDWRLTGAATYSGPGGSSGEGDMGGYPRSQRRRGDWPTLIVESGYTQSMPSLYAKMRWWFSASNHGVKVIILIKMFRREIRIHIEKWQEVIPRPGATATRWATGAGLVTPQPRCLQTIDICWDGPVPFAQASQAVREDPDSFRVTGGPLTIDFALVFLRTPGTGEHDFIVDNDDLKALASSAMEI